MASAFRLDDGFNSKRPRPQPTPTPVLALPKRDPFVGRNRRFLPRVSQRFDVRSDDVVCEGIDLSFSGMMCRAEEVVWPGNEIDFELLLPDEPRPIPVRGRVVEVVSHRGELALRVAFEDMSARGRRQIALWMARAA